MASRARRGGRAITPALLISTSTGVPSAIRPSANSLTVPTVMTTGALWPHTQPSAAMLAAYEADPELAAMRLDFTATLREVLEVMSAGLLARGGCDGR